MISENYRIMAHKITLEVMGRYKEVYDLSYKFFSLENPQVREKAKPQFMDALTDLHQYYKKILPRLLVADIPFEERSNLIASILDNNNVIMARWASQVGLKLEELTNPLI